MKLTFLILGITILYGKVIAQTVSVSGTVHWSADSLNIELVQVRLIERGVMKYGVNTDSKGNFSITNVQHGTYTFVLIAGKSGSEYFTSDYPDQQTLPMVVGEGSAHFNLYFACPYKQPPDIKGICPLDQHDRVIPIVYGEPSRRNFRAVKKGKLILGGCLVTHCDPHWYCKKHDLKF